MAGASQSLKNNVHCENGVAINKNVLILISNGDTRTKEKELGMGVINEAFPSR